MKTYVLRPLVTPVTKTVAVPGSKSYTNKALVLAALTKGTVTLTNALDSDDTQAMVTCLQTLGIHVQHVGTTLTITSDITAVQPQDYLLDANLSGTTIRFITALACITPGTKTITGAQGLKKRPIGDLVDALRQLGAKISYEEKEGYPPIRITSEKLQPGKITCKGTISSQYISALLMIAPLVGNIELCIQGEQISKPYVAMTLACMTAFGVDVENHGYTSYKISTPQSYKKETYAIEGDYSSAGYFFAIAAITKSTITVTNLNSNSVQADKQFLPLLEYMGNTVTYGNDSITLKGNTMKPVSVSLNDYPDQAQTLAVLSAFISGKTVIEHIASLRVKETERIQAVETELGKMGIKTQSSHDSLTIYGGMPHAATIATYGDHRMAMAFAIAGAKIPEIKIENPDVVNKTFPSFWKTLEHIGIGVQTL
jgi:3-phosphoshikimate 1-carboxyvinyltransferase